MNNKKIVKEVEDLLTGRERLKRTQAERMKRAESEAEAARREMERATKADDEAAFIAAADKERFNNSIIASCRERLEAMENVPREEAAAMVRQIQAAIEEVEQAATKKATDSLKSFCTIAGNAEAEIDSLQELIARYCNATGNAELIRPYIKRNSELISLYYQVQENRNRKAQAGVKSALYNGV